MAANYELVDGSSQIGLIVELDGWCNFCRTRDLDVVYDARLGPAWGYACEKCFHERGGRLGIGFGQKFRRVSNDEK
jgi:hypothetical protein